MKRLRVRLLLPCALGLSFFCHAAVAQESFDQNQATPISQIKAAKDFKVELLYSVPRDQQGSWVNLCVDPKGRIIASDHHSAREGRPLEFLGTYDPRQNPERIELKTERETSS